MSKPSGAASTDPERQFADMRTRPRRPVQEETHQFATTLRWQRVIRGRTFSFQISIMNNGEVRWFANRLTPYANYDARFACSWKRALTVVFPRPLQDPDELPGHQGYYPY